MAIVPPSSSSSTPTHSNSGLPIEIGRVATILYILNASFETIYYPHNCVYIYIEVTFILDLDWVLHTFFIYCRESFESNVLTMKESYYFPREIPGASWEVSALFKVFSAWEERRLEWLTFSKSHPKPILFQNLQLWKELLLIRSLYMFRQLKLLKVCVFDLYS